MERVIENVGFREKRSWLWVFLSDTQWKPLRSRLRTRLD